MKSRGVPKGQPQPYDADKDLHDTMMKVVADAFESLKHSPSPPTPKKQVSFRPGQVGINAQTSEPVFLSNTDRFTGCYIVGKMGMGKSTLIQSLVIDQLQTGVGCLVIEPHGDLIHDILHMIPKSREQDVVLLDFGDEPYAPGFDLFDGKHLVGAVSQQQYIDKVVSAFEKTLGKDSWGPRLENLIRCIAITFMKNPGSTMAEMELLLTNEEFRAKCVRNVVSNGSVWRFWDQFERMKGKDAYIESTMTKIRAFLFNPMLAAIVSQPGKCIDFVQAIRKRQIVLISLPEAILGETGVDLLGTLYLSRLRAAVSVQTMTAPDQRTPFFVYLDEFQRFASSDVSQFLAESRKANIGLTMAHQWRSQIEDPAVRAAPLAAGNKFIFNVTPEDAAAFARDLQTAPFREPEEPPAVEPAKDPLTHLGLELSEWGITYSHKETREFRAWRAPEEVRDRTRSVVGKIMGDSTDMSLLSWRIPAGLLYSKANSCYFGTNEDMKYFTQLFHYLSEPIAVIWFELNQYLQARQKRARGAESILSSIFSTHSQRSLDNLEQYWNHLWKGSPRFTIGQALEEGYRKDPESRVTHEKTYEAWRRFSKDATELGDILEAYPICTIDSAREHRHALSQATKPPTKDEIAGSLTHLARYHCHCKLSQGAQTVELALKTQQINLQWEAADIEAIRWRSRIAYALPMDEALGQMNERQEAYWKDVDLLFPEEEPPRRGAID